MQSMVSGDDINLDSLDPQGLGLEGEAIWEEHFAPARDQIKVINALVDWVLSMHGSSIPEKVCMGKNYHHKCGVLFSKEMKIKLCFLSHSLINATHASICNLKSPSLDNIENSCSFSTPHSKSFSFE